MTRKIVLTKIMLRRWDICRPHVQATEILLEITFLYYTFPSEQKMAHATW